MNQFVKRNTNFEVNLFWPMLFLSNKFLYKEGIIHRNNFLKFLFVSMLCLTPFLFILIIYR